MAASPRTKAKIPVEEKTPAEKQAELWGGEVVAAAKSVARKRKALGAVVADLRAIPDRHVRAVAAHMFLEDIKHLRDDTLEVRRKAVNAYGQEPELTFGAISGLLAVHRGTAQTIRTGQTGFKRLKAARETARAAEIG